MDVEATAKSDRGGYAAIVPGDVEQSELVRRITSNDESERMPPAEHGKPLSAAEIDLLKRWIEAGASGNWPGPTCHQSVMHVPL